MILTLRTLHTRSASLIVILVHLVPVLRSTPLPVVGLFQGDFVNGEFLARGSRGHDQFISGREGLFEQTDNVGVDVRGEVDGDADVEVAHVVVSVRGHTLVRDYLESVYMSAVFRLWSSKSHDQATR